MGQTQESQVVLLGPKGEALIRKTPGVCGGRACVRTTRIPVWLLVEARQHGTTDETLRRSFGMPLTQADLNAAWDYDAGHTQEIEQDIWQNEACMIEQDKTDVPVSLLIKGRQLGLPDEIVRDAFYPPLAQSALDQAWQYYEQHRDEVEHEIRRKKRA